MKAYALYIDRYHKSPIAVVEAEIVGDYEWKTVLRIDERVVEIKSKQDVLINPPVWRGGYAGYSMTREGAELLTREIAIEGIRYYKEHLEYVQGWLNRWESVLQLLDGGSPNPLSSTGPDKPADHDSMAAEPPQDSPRKPWWRFWA